MSCGQKLVLFSARKETRTPTSTRQVPGKYPASTQQVTAQVTAQVTEQVGEFCREPRTAKEIMEMLGLKHWKTFQTNYLNPLLDAGWIERTIPDKPRSSKQQYRLTEKGKQLLEQKS